MRRFEDFDWSRVPEGQLVLMTVESLNDPRAKMKIADMRDMQALAVAKNGCWVGCSPTRGLRFGRGPVRMVDGVWFCREDVESQKGSEDMPLSPDALSLEMIK